ALASAEAGELALLATRAGILGGITLSLQTDTDYKNPERKKVLQEQFKKEEDDPVVKQFREQNKQWLADHSGAAKGFAGGSIQDITQQAAHNASVLSEQREAAASLPGQPPAAASPLDFTGG